MNPRNLFRNAFVAVAAGALLTSAAALSACGDDDDDDASADPTMASGTMTTGETFKLGSLEIMGLSARASDGDTSAVYLTVKNSGAADTLLSAKSPASKETQIHETITEGSSMKMQELKDGAAVPGSGELTLKPGGYHVMLMGLISPLKDGDSIKVSLTFKNAGTIEVTAPVKTITATMGQ